MCKWTSQYSQTLTIFVLIWHNINQKYSGIVLFVYFFVYTYLHLRSCVVCLCWIEFVQLISQIIFFCLICIMVGWFLFNIKQNLIYFHGCMCMYIVCASIECCGLQGYPSPHLCVWVWSALCQNSLFVFNKSNRNSSISSFYWKWKPGDDFFHPKTHFCLFSWNFLFSLPKIFELLAR